MASTNIALSDLCKMSRTHFKSRKSVKVFSVGIAMTFVAFLFQGLSFFGLANAVHEHIGLLESLMATSASTALATLPITIGGSGLAELGVWAYISNLGGIPHFADILNDSQLVGNYSMENSNIPYSTCNNVDMSYEDNNR